MWSYVGYGHVLDGVWLDGGLELSSNCERSAVLPGPGHSLDLNTGTDIIILGTMSGRLIITVATARGLFSELLHGVLSR